MFIAKKNILLPFFSFLNLGFHKLGAMPGIAHDIVSDGLASQLECLDLEKQSEKAITLHNAAAEKDSFSFSPSEESDWIADEVPLIPVKQQTKSLHKVLDNLNNLLNTNGNPPIAQDLRDIHQLLKETIDGLVQLREDFYPVEEAFNTQRTDPKEALKSIHDLYKKLMPKKSSKISKTLRDKFNLFYEALEKLEKNQVPPILQSLEKSLHSLAKIGPCTGDEESIRLLLEQGVFEAIEYLYTHDLIDYRPLKSVFSDTSVFKLLKRHLSISFYKKHAYSPELTSHFSAEGDEEKRYLQNFVTDVYPQSKNTFYSKSALKTPPYLLTED